MTAPDRAARLVAGWVRLYTRGLPAQVARRRIEEIDADVHDQLAHERARGTGDRRAALGLASRMVRGAAADAAWRDGQLQLARGLTPRAATRRARRAHRLALAASLLTLLFILWLMGAVGIVGVEGDPGDLLYLGVLGVGLVGAAVARLRPAGMARALAAAAAAQALVAAISVLAGMHDSPATSIWELLGLNAFFMALFLGSALLFLRAAARQPALRAGRDG